MHTEDKKFQKIIDEYLQEFCFNFPTFATYLGIHKYDDNLEDYNKKNIKNMIEMFNNYNNRIKKEIKNELLDNENRLDYKLILNEINCALLELKEIKRWQKNPCFYIDDVIYSIYILIVREFAPINIRLKNILERMKKIPKVLEIAKENISNPPKVYLDVAKEVTNAAILFFSEVIPEYAKKLPKLEKELNKVNKEVINSFRNYLNYLDEVYKIAYGEYRIGKRLFNIMLKDVHSINYTATELERIAWEILKDTHQKIKLISKKINPKKKWSDVIEELKQNYPPKDTLLSTYKDELKKIKEFILKKEFVTIPKDEEIKVIETPLFMQPTTPYAAYMPPAAFETNQKGLFYVTPTDNKEKLKAHNIYHITSVCIHEAYPGHHLQFVHTNKYSTKVRKILRRSILIEGWAHYTEALMNEYNYYNELPYLLFHLKDILWRAARVIVDIGLHYKNMKIDEAVEFLVKEAALEKHNAEVEVKRYTMAPTYQLCYLIGKLEIMKLREEYKKIKRNKFNIKEFHDKLLSYGNIPVKFIKESIK